MVRLFMRYTNLAIQTILISVILISLMLFLIDKDGWWANAFFVTQLCLGLWQYMGVVLSFKRAASQLRRYLQVASVFVFVLVTFLLFHDVIPGSEIAYIPLTVISPSMLAAFCYIHTWKRAILQNQKKGRFLPNVSF